MGGMAAKRGAYESTEILFCRLYQSGLQQIWSRFEPVLQSVECSSKEFQSEETTWFARTGLRAGFVVMKREQLTSIKATVHDSAKTLNRIEKGIKFSNPNMGSERERSSARSSSHGYQVAASFRFSTQMKMHVTELQLLYGKCVNSTIGISPF